MMVQMESHPESSNFVYSSMRGEPDFSDLLPFFVDELPQKRATLHSLGQANDFDQLKQEAHKLRGSAGGYGFQVLSDLAGHLEDSCKNPTRDETTILRNLDELLDYLSKVRA